MSLLSSAAIASLFSAVVMLIVAIQEDLMLTYWLSSLLFLCLAVALMLANVLVNPGAKESAQANFPRAARLAQGFAQAHPPQGFAQAHPPQFPSQQQPFRDQQTYMGP
jgi:hypothetical protein